VGEFLGSAAPQPQEASGENGADLAQVRCEGGIGGLGSHGWQPGSAVPGEMDSENKPLAGESGYKGSQAQV
jgi:hypothetical protein